MNWKIALLRFLLVVSATATTSIAIAGPLDDKSPAYFVDRYGPAKSSKAVSSHAFVHVSRGSVGVKGQFSVREFRKDDLRVQPVYFLPSLKLAAVRLQLNRAWTPEQIEAALKAYGGEWKLVKSGIVTHWVAPDGSLAISMLTWLDIQSKEIVELAAQTIAEADAKKKAVPQF